MSNPSLINLGDLAKPASTLIEKVSAAVGALWEPRQVRRIAKANADAAVIAAEGEIRVEDVHRRAMARFIHEEGRKQENIESITEKALPHLADDADPSEVDDDWIVNFFDKSRIVGDNEMQELWSRILAGEANAPGSISRRTVNLMGSLDKLDAELFNHLCGFACWIEGKLYPLVYEVDFDSYYHELELSFDALVHLDAAGLIRFDSTRGFIGTFSTSNFIASFHGNVIEGKLTGTVGTERKSSLDVGTVILTASGQELAKVVVPTVPEGFIELVLQRWQGPWPGGVRNFASPYPRESANELARQARFG